MDSEQERQAATFASGLILGAVIGAGVALLTTPSSGSKTRRKIRRAASGMRRGTPDRFDDMAADVRGRVDDVLRGARRRLER